MASHDIPKLIFGIFTGILHSTVWRECALPTSESDRDWVQDRVEFICLKMAPIWIYGALVIYTRGGLHSPKSLSDTMTEEFDQRSK